MNIIRLIQEKYGTACQLRSPLNKRQFHKAKKILPPELLEILTVSNGIHKIGTNPDTGKSEIIGQIVESFAQIRSYTDCYLSEYGSEGVVFAEDGMGGFFVLKPDGKIYFYEYYKLCETYYAESLWEYFKNH